jgi:hypothetical protein
MALVPASLGAVGTAQAKITILTSQKGLKTF